MVHNHSELAEIAGRLERSFDAPFTFEGYVLHGTASVGFALYPEDGTTKDSMLSAADAAMYVAKQSKHQVDELPSGLQNPHAPSKGHPG
jgi:GGDEF domain-containing protein